MAAALSASVSNSLCGNSYKLKRLHPVRLPAFPDMLLLQLPFRSFKNIGKTRSRTTKTGAGVSQVHH